jgi:hypothetical protein
MPIPVAEWSKAAARLLGFWVQIPLCLSLVCVVR